MKNSVDVDIQTPQTECPSGLTSTRFDTSRNVDAKVPHRLQDVAQVGGYKGKLRH